MSPIRPLDWGYGGVLSPEEVYQQRMARVLYGVQGDAHGHAIRALIVARRFPEHEFLFVSYDHGAKLLGREFKVFECPGPETVVRNHRLDTLRTLQSNLQFLRRERRGISDVMRLADKFKPDAAVTDYEYFVPRVCRRMELPCLSLDHQHIITSCFHQVPLYQLSSYMATYLAVRWLFSAASDYVVTSFFRPAVRGGAVDVKLVSPFLRQSVFEIEPTNGDHVVAYRSHPPSGHFLPFLKNIRRPVMLYGFNVDRIDGNLHFKKLFREGVSGGSGFLRLRGLRRRPQSDLGSVILREAGYVFPYRKPLRTVLERLLPGKVRVRKEHVRIQHES